MADFWKARWRPPKLRLHNFALSRTDHIKGSFAFSKLPLLWHGAFHEALSLKQSAVATANGRFGQVLAL
jgi:hypothetical protein